MPPVRSLAARFRLLDLASIAYLLFSAAVLVVFGGDVAIRWSRTALYLILAAGVLLANYWSEPAGRPPRTGYALRSLVPLLLVAFTWGELRMLMPLVWGGAYWGTPIAVASDQMLFGGHPTVMIQALYRDWLDEIMGAMYFAYYLFLTVPLVLLARRQYERALAAASIVAVTYFSMFTFFVLAPTKGPRHVWELDLVPREFGGYFFGPLIHTLQSSESVVGAALPSSHVAGSVACAIVAAWWVPRLGRFLLPLSLGVAVSTVYLGYHHAVDPLTGILWGAAGALGGRAWLRRRDEWPGDAATEL
jgi:membrane-associated phospholipid phosphatase